MKKTYLIVRDKPHPRNAFSSTTRAKYDQILKDGGEVFIIVDNSASPFDGFVWDWREPNKVAFRSYDAWEQRSSNKHREVEFG